MIAANYLNEIVFEKGFWHVKGEYLPTSTHSGVQQVFDSEGRTVKEAINNLSGKYRFEKSAFEKLSVDKQNLIRPHLIKLWSGTIFKKRVWYTHRDYEGRISERMSGWIYKRGIQSYKEYDVPKKIMPLPIVKPVITPIIKPVITPIIKEETWIEKIINWITNLFRM